MSNYLILVPARFGSSRFPGKPLAKINGKSMIEYVMENCTKYGFDWSIVTDNEDIEREVLKFGGHVVRVDDDVSTGSERIALAYKRYFSQKKQYEQVINVQGDEPLLTADIIQKIAKEHSQSDFDIYTAVKKRISSDSEFKNPNIVKCIKSSINSQCLYFSRESIPFNKTEEKFNWFQHIGLYSYKPTALVSFVGFKESFYEKYEKLEQLRALENGLTIGASEVEVNLIGVDTPDDIKKVEGVLSEQEN